MKDVDRYIQKHKGKGKFEELRPQLVEAFAALKLQQPAV